MAENRHYALAREAILAALTAYTGITTAPGATPANNTLICADLINKNDFISNKTILIGSGDAAYEDSGASSFNVATGEITVVSAFSAQIKAGVLFRVLNISTIEVDVALILAAILAIQTQTNKLTGAADAGIHAHADDLLFQTVFEFNPLAIRRKVHSIWMDFFNFAAALQTVIYRLSYMVDGVNYRISDSNAAFPWAIAMDDGVLIAVNSAIDHPFRLEIQKSVAEGGPVNVPYEVIYEDMS